MKNIISFLEFTKINETTMTEGSCMSEKMIAQCEAMCEAMCKEMKACHEDETKHTAESYKSECNEKLSEMMKVVEKMCEDYMNN